MEYGIYGDLILICPKPYSIYLRGEYTFYASLCALEALFWEFRPYTGVAGICRVRGRDVYRKYTKIV